MYEKLKEIINDRKKFLFDHSLGSKPASAVYGIVIEMNGLDWVLAEIEKLEEGEKE